MPAETAATRTIRSQLTQLENEANRCAADQQAAVEKATRYRRQAEGVRDTLMQGGVSYLEPRSREMLTQYRDEMLQAVTADVSALGHAFRRRSLKERHDQGRRELEQALKSAPTTTGRT